MRLPCHLPPVCRIKGFEDKPDAEGELHVGSKKFEAHNAGELTRPERHRVIDPVGLLRWAGLREGERVLDLGCGTGFFTRAALQVVGDAGLVVGFDVNREMLRRFRVIENDGRIPLVLNGERELPVRTNAVDFAILGFVLHEVDDPNRILREVRRMLRETGRLLVVEWVKQAEEHGPPQAHRLSEAETKRMLLDEGFVPARSKPIEKSFYAIVAERLNIRCCGARSVHYQ